MLVCYGKGLDRNSVLETCTATYIMERASVSTLPFCIDDPSEKPSKGCDLNDVVVELYNHGKSGTMRKGSVLPISCPVITN